MSKNAPASAVGSDRPTLRAGSLVELLVVMLILVVLYSVVVGPTASYLRGQKLTRCAENMRRLPNI